MAILPNIQMKKDSSYLKNKPLIEAKAAIMKAFAHPARLWMIEKLFDGETCVCEFVDGLGLDFSTVSKHLSILKNSNIVDCRKVGKEVYYSLCMGCAKNFLSCAESFAKQSAKDAKKKLRC